MPTEPAPGHTVIVFHLSDVGGPGFSLLPISRELARSGTLECFAPADGWITQTYGDLGGVTVADYGALTYARGPLEAARLAWRLVRDVRGFQSAFRRRRPERVVVVTTSLPSALIAARLERIPTVVYAAEVYDEGFRDAPVRRLLGKLLTHGTARAADAVVCCSETVARQFPRDSNAHVAVAFPPIGVPVAPDPSVREDLAGTQPCLAVVGALSRGRGQDLAIRALPLVRRRFPGAQLLIVGAPHPRTVDLEFARELREVADELRIADSVQFTGAVDDMRAVYEKADVVVNPARFPEPFGRVAPEALAAGRPVVATRVGALEEVIRHEETGLLVPPEDHEAIAEAVIRILDDPKLAARLVATGREDVIALFSEDRALAVWREAIGRLSRRGQNAPRPLSTA